MSQSVLPRAETRPTDKRAGRSIPVHVANCPYCRTEGTVSITVQLCHNCGRWFEATPPADASHLKAKRGDDA